MIRIPNPTWQQSNKSDKFGNLSATRCINLDQEGYVKLSSRAMSVYTEDSSAPGFDSQIGRIITIGRYGDGDFTSVTSDSNHDIDLSSTVVDGVEDEEASNPSYTVNSWGAFWQNRWYVTTATTLAYKAISGGPTGAWTANAVTGLTSGVTHALEVFKNRNTLCITDANVVRQYDTSHSAGTAVTLPSDYEAIALAYSNYRMGIITRLASTLEGQGTDAYFFVWDGSSTSASMGIPIGSDAAVAIVAYKGSWVILTRTGQLLFFNGGGFDELAAFPFYYSTYVWGDFINKVALGQIMWVEGDVIYINVAFNMDQYGRFLESYLPYCPSGIWAYDPKVGLYHRYAPSQSYLNTLTVTSGGVNTTTNVLTANSGTVPSTGSMVRYADAGGTPITGLKEYHDYFVIKLSSTTFSLAETYDAALLGAAIDITSTGAATNSFLSLEMLDFNAVDINNSGALTVVGTYDQWGDHMIFGSDVYDYDSTNAWQHYMVTVPNAPNRGYFVTAKIYSQGTTDTQQKLVLRHKLLQDGDMIVIKEKHTDLFGLPTSTRRATNGVTWTAQNAFYTTADIEEVYDAWTAGHAIEVEVLSGAGAGAMAEISDITYASGTYAVTLNEDIPYVIGGRVANVQFDNFKEYARVTVDNQKDGYVDCPIGLSSKWSMYKVELRGVNTTIEDVTLVSVPHKLPV